MFEENRDQEELKKQTELKALSEENRKLREKLAQKGVSFKNTQGKTNESMNGAESFKKYDSLEEDKGNEGNISMRELLNTFIDLSRKKENSLSAIVTKELAVSKEEICESFLEL